MTSDINTQTGDLRVDVNVSVSRDGERRPPITEDEIYHICGRSLLNGMDVSYQRTSDTQINLVLDKNADWRVEFFRDG